jgi:hypothetical protein
VFVVPMTGCSVLSSRCQARVFSRFHRIEHSQIRPAQFVVVSATDATRSLAFLVGSTAIKAFGTTGGLDHSLSHECDACNADMNASVALVHEGALAYRTMGGIQLWYPQHRLRPGLVGPFETQPGWFFGIRRGSENL